MVTSGCRIQYGALGMTRYLLAESSFFFAVFISPERCLHSLVKDTYALVIEIGVKIEVRNADKQRLLLVEDEEGIVSLLEETLRDAGFELEVAKSGSQALTI